ncbi:MAG: hypothetical protein J7L45_02665 [Candidatus Aenigmarchaeota archaeon]|nr:hypothetical protein [Candidatus Aenigmarchaeota archaeon]
MSENYDLNVPEVWDTVLSDKDENYFDLKTTVKRNSDILVMIKRKAIGSRLFNRKKVRNYLDKLERAKEEYVSSAWKFIDKVYSDFNGEKAMKIVDDGMKISEKPMDVDLDEVLEILYVFSKDPDVIEYKDYILEMSKNYHKFERLFGKWV